MMRRRLSLHIAHLHNNSQALIVLLIFEDNESLWRDGTLKGPDGCEDRGGNAEISGGDKVILQGYTFFNLNIGSSVNIIK